MGRIREDMPWFAFAGTEKDPDDFIACGINWDVEGRKLFVTLEKDGSITAVQRDEGGKYTGKDNLTAPELFEMIRWLTDHETFESTKDWREW